jgi:GNAT superfamily N-acetyltransferase
MCVPFLNWLVEIIGCEGSRAVDGSERRLGYSREAIRSSNELSDLPTPPGVNAVTEAEADRVVELFTLAFYDDPTWSWAFPDPDRRREQHRAWWGLYVRAALVHESVLMTDDGGAAAIWIPPGKTELSAEDEARVEPLLRDLLGAHADDVLTLLDRFEDHHPHGEPHFYLTMLGTHPDHRGHGKGMGLLAASLRQFDEQGIPTFLESSNRANDRRYERLGFTVIDEFAAPSGGPTVGCMWRDATDARPRRRSTGG